MARMAEWTSEKDKLQRIKEGVHHLFINTGQTALLMHPGSK